MRSKTAHMMGDLFDAAPAPTAAVISLLQSKTDPDRARREATKDIIDCAAAHLAAAGHLVAREIKVPSGGRADIATIAPTGRIWIIEAKSNWVDFRSDRKWQQYRRWCDTLVLAVDVGFPTERLPDNQDVMLCGHGDAWFDRSPAYHLSAQADLNAMRRRIQARIDWDQYAARALPRTRRRI